MLVEKDKGVRRLKCLNGKRGRGLWLGRGGGDVLGMVGRDDTKIECCSATGVEVVVSSSIISYKM